MVEINNQRKAFLDMLAWSEGTDNGRQKTRNHGYGVFNGNTELFMRLLDHPRKLVTLNPKLKSTGARRYQLLSRWLGCLPQAAWPEDFSPKSQDAVALQQIKERGALPMIDRGDIRQAIDRCSNIWASLPGAGYGRICRTGGNDLKMKKWADDQEGDGDAEMSRLSHFYGYHHHRLPVMGC